LQRSTPLRAGSRTQTGENCIPLRLADNDSPVADGRPQPGYRSLSAMARTEELKRSKRSGIVIVSVRIRFTGPHLASLSCTRTGTRLRTAISAPPLPSPATNPNVLSSADDWMPPKHRYRLRSPLWHANHRRPGSTQHCCLHSLRDPETIQRNKACSTAQSLPGCTEYCTKVHGLRDSTPL